MSITSINSRQGRPELSLTRQKPRKAGPSVSSASLDPNAQDSVQIPVKISNAGTGSPAGIVRTVRA